MALRMAAKRSTPVKAIGQFVREIRERSDVSQIALATKAGLRNELLSRLEKGENVEIIQYERVAKALGFRGGALEMFRTGNDRLLRDMLKFWRALPDDEARTDALRLMKRSLLLDEEPGATSGEE